MSKPLILIGAGGHAKVLLDALNCAGRHLIGICDIALKPGDLWMGLPVLGPDSAVLEYQTQDIELVNGVGMLPHRKLRQQISERFEAQGYQFAQVIHPLAIIAGVTNLAPGVQVMAGCVIQPSVSLGRHVIVNTRAGIDHDCIIGDFVHIAPGATLCGEIAVEVGAFVGSGATILPSLRIGAGAIIGAGAVVTRDIPAGAMLKPVASILKAR